MKKISVVVKINPKKNKCNSFCPCYIAVEEGLTYDSSFCSIDGEYKTEDNFLCPYSDYPEVKE